jgi:hypothetical protein
MMGAQWAALVLLAACGRYGFEGTPRQASAITITVDNGYVVTVGTPDDLGSEIANIANDGENQIADCPLGNGPERWELGTSGVLYIYAWDIGDVRGVRAQLETPSGPLPIELAGIDACAGTFSIYPLDDAAGAAQELFAACNAHTAAFSGTWTNAGGTGELESGVWNRGYPTCPGVFTDASSWFWWSDGSFDPLVTGAGPDEILLRLTITPP